MAKEFLVFLVQLMITILLFAGQILNSYFANNVPQQDS